MIEKITYDSGIADTSAVVVANIAAILSRSADGEGRESLTGDNEANLRFGEERRGLGEDGEGGVGEEDSDDRGDSWRTHDC